MIGTGLPAAIAEGRVICPVCPECGSEVQSCTYDADLRVVEVLEPLWPGGPLFPNGQEELKPGNPTTTLGCGHTLPQRGELSWRTFPTREAADAARVKP